MGFFIEILVNINIISFSPSFSLGLGRLGKAVNVSTVYETLEPSETVKTVSD
jgi:hypothetical protein